METQEILSEVAFQLSFLAFAVVKFLYTPGVMLAAGYPTWQAIAVTAAGGILGAVLIFKAGRAIFAWYNKLFPSKKKKRVFTKGKRRIIFFKKKFGLIGLAFIVPLISIPLSAAIASKYYKNTLNVVIVYGITLTMWSVVITLFSGRLLNFVTSLFPA